MFNWAPRAKILSSLLTRVLKKKALPVTIFDLSLLRVPAWPSRSRRPTSSARLSSRRTASETFSTWPHWPASTKATKTSSAVRRPAGTRGFHTCPVGPTWRLWPRTSGRTKPKVARSCDWSDWGGLDWGWGQSTVQAGSYGATLFPAC